MLDLACGAGRHTRLLAGLGHHVVAVDRDLRGVSDLTSRAAIELVEADLEADAPFPLDGRRFDGVVVTRYLHRPLLPALLAALAAGGVLIYETFSVEQPRFGRPTNPRFLLRHGELLDVVRGALRVLAYEDLVLDQPHPSAVQRIVARRLAASSSSPEVLRPATPERGRRAQHP